MTKYASITEDDLSKLKGALATARAGEKRTKAQLRALQKTVSRVAEEAQTALAVQKEGLQALKGAVDRVYALLNLKTERVTPIEMLAVLEARISTLHVLEAAEKERERSGVIFVQPTEVQRAILTALGLDETATAETVANRIIKLVESAQRDAASNNEATLLYKILVALGLPPGASDKDIVGKLVALSDAALAGRQILQRLHAELLLPEGRPLDAVFAALHGKLKGHVELAVGKLPGACGESCYYFDPSGCCCPNFDGVADTACEEPPGEPCSCYVGKNAGLARIMQQLRELLDLEGRNVTVEDFVAEVKRVIDVSRANQESSDAADRELTEAQHALSETRRALRQSKATMRELTQRSRQFAALGRVLGREAQFVNHFLEETERQDRREQQEQPEE